MNINALCIAFYIFGIAVGLIAAKAIHLREIRIGQKTIAAFRLMTLHGPAIMMDPSNPHALEYVKLANDTAREISRCVKKNAA